MKALLSLFLLLSATPFSVHADDPTFVERQSDSVNGTLRQLCLNGLITRFDVEAETETRFFVQEPIRMGDAISFSLEVEVSIPPHSLEIRQNLEGGQHLGDGYNWGDIRERFVIRTQRMEITLPYSEEQGFQFHAVKEAILNALRVQPRVLGQGLNMETNAVRAVDAACLSAGLEILRPYSAAHRFVAFVSDLTLYRRHREIASRSAVFVAQLLGMD